MKLKIECIPCIMAMTTKALRRLELKGDELRQLMSEILTIPGLQGLDWEKTSPDIIEVILTKINKAAGSNDPFRKDKIDVNRKMMAMQPFVQKLIDSSDDPLESSAKLAIFGNSIDIMMPGGLDSVESYIRGKADSKLVAEPFSRFRSKLKEARRIVYFTDNCGEIVLDKLFIEVLKKEFDPDITVVVRHMPALNDATLQEASETGLDKTATVIDNGINGPLPGTILSRCSQQVQDLVAKSDLMISKGGGNYDSLSEQLHEIHIPLSFMLLSKCRPINTRFKTDLHQAIIKNINF